jgi:hypothetical protein
MNYAAARDLIQDGDVVVVKRRSSALAVLTRLVTRSPYTHTGIAVWSGGRLLLVQANGGGVNAAPLSQEAEFAFDVYDPPAGLARSEIVQAAWDAIGARLSYAIADLFEIWLYLWFGIPLPEKPGEDPICSLLTARILMAAGWAPVNLPSIPWPSAVADALGKPPRLSVVP